MILLNSCEDPYALPDGEICMVWIEEAEHVSTELEEDYYNGTCVCRWSNTKELERKPLSYCHKNLSISADYYQLLKNDAETKVNRFRQVSRKLRRLERTCR